MPRGRKAPTSWPVTSPSQRCSPAPLKCIAPIASKPPARGYLRRLSPAVLGLAGRPVDVACKHRPPRPFSVELPCPMHAARQLHHLLLHAQDLFFAAETPP